MIRQAAIAAALLLLVAPACGDDDDDGETTGTSSTTAIVDETTSSTSTTQPPGGPSDEPSTEQPVGSPGTDAVSADGARGLLKDVRLAHHEGFDRIVLEFEGAVPGYRVEYVDPPITEDASGEPVDVDGEAFLQVRLEPSSGVDLAGEEPREVYTGPTRLDGPGQPIEELVRTGDFEAVLTWVAGVAEKADFGVLALDSPPRLVIDVVSS